MPDTRTAFRTVKAATVAIAIMAETQDGTCPFRIVGSGFCIDPTGIVVSCEHVMSHCLCKSPQEQIAEFEQTDSKRGIRVFPVVIRYIPHVIFFRTDLDPNRLIAIPIPVTTCMTKTDFDLAGVRVMLHAGFPNGFPFLKIEDYQNICEGDEIATCGFPLGNFLQDQLGTATSSFTKGIISSIIPAPDVPKNLLKGFQLNLTATHGNSGGPVFSLNTGKVFGVLQRAVHDREGNLLPGLTKAEPIYPVLKHDFLNRIKQMPQLPTPNQLASIARGAKPTVRKRIKT